MRVVPVPIDSVTYTVHLSMCLLSLEFSANVIGF